MSRLSKNKRFWQQFLNSKTLGGLAEKELHKLDRNHKKRLQKQR